MFNQIKSAVKYTDTSQCPYNDPQVISWAYFLILQTGIYNDACCEWHLRAIVDQTWDNFKTNFTTTHHDLRVVQAATQDSGTKNVNTDLPKIQEDH